MTGMDSPQTFAAGQGPGSGKGCWKRVTVWAAACQNHTLVGVASGCLSVPLHLCAGGEGENEKEIPL